MAGVEAERDQNVNPNQDNLLSKLLRSDGKTYFLDVRSNQRGEFLKLTEKRNQNKRQTVLLSSSAVAQLQDLLTTTISTETQPSEDNNWSTISTQKIVLPNKRIYFDIMVNKFGKSLNIAEISQSKGKHQVIVSEQGWPQLKTLLEEITKEFPSFGEATDQYVPQEREDKGKILKSKKLSLKTKVIFFDFIETDDGRVLKVSEVRNKRRDTLFFPEICMEPLDQLLEKLNEGNFTAEVDGMRNDEEEGEQREGLLSKKVLELEGEPPSKNRTFNLEFKENEHGKFLKMNEVGGRGNVFLPMDAFNEVKETL